MPQDNLRTHDGLPAVKNDRGEVMSEVSITVTDPRLNGGKPTNIPSLWGGKIVDEDTAVSNALQTEKEYKSFESIKEAVTDAVRRSDAGGANAPDKYAQGGVAMKDQMKMFADGGMMDDSGEVVNGVEVPTGSMANEVADDIPAKLSEGEFVIPADVVRYIGLEKLMALRDKAKDGLSRMEDIGQVGNADEVANPDETFEGGEEEDNTAFESDIDGIMGEMEQEEGFAAGGYISGADLSKAPKNSAIDVRYFKHADGRMIYITYVNNRPMTAIPDGFMETENVVDQKVGKAADDKAEVVKTEVEKTATSGGDVLGAGLTAAQIKAFDTESTEAKNARMGKIDAAISKFGRAALFAVAPGVEAAFQARNFLTKTQDKLAPVEEMSTIYGAGTPADTTAIRADVKTAANKRGIAANIAKAEKEAANRASESPFSGSGDSTYGGSRGSNTGTSNPNSYSSSRSSGESDDQNDAGGYTMGDAKGGFISPKAATNRKAKAVAKGLASKRK